MNNATNITVEQAEEIILSQPRDFGTELIPYDTALGRILAEPLYADRDLPPFDRATVDGIAIRFEAYRNGFRSFKIRHTQAAGEASKAIAATDECIEIMTGAALDTSVNTVIRYEDIDIINGIATVKDVQAKEGQHIHTQGTDRKKGDIVAAVNGPITSTLIGMAASIGKTQLLVKRLPKVVIITTGDELVNVEAQPLPYQIRRSNGITIQSVLKRYSIQADTLHLDDAYDTIKSKLQSCLETYDVLLLTGGVSMGKFDYIPQILETLGVAKHFHKVRQRPGKPFWFGTYQNQQVIFALPGNPVSVLACLHRYCIPWLEQCWGITKSSYPYAVLQDDIHFPHPLQYFAQVKLEYNQQGGMTAQFFAGNGSGDFSTLVFTDAFMELPLEQTTFKKGESYRVWPYNF